MLNRRPNNPKTANVCHTKLRLGHELQYGLKPNMPLAGLLTSCKLILCSRLTKLLSSKCEQMTKTKIYDNKPALLSDMVTTDSKQNECPYQIPCQDRTDHLLQCNFDLTHLPWRWWLQCSMKCWRIVTYIVVKPQQTKSHIVFWKQNFVLCHLMWYTCHLHVSTCIFNISAQLNLRTIHYCLKEDKWTNFKNSIFCPNSSEFLYSLVNLILSIFHYKSQCLCEIFS